MLIIWLQGIWLPLHGYDFADTPLWAGIYMLPLTAGLPDRRADLRLRCRTGTAPRLFATGGLLVAAGAFLGLMLLPIDFPYWIFAAAHLPQRRRLRACSPRRTRPRS